MKNVKELEINELHPLIADLFESDSELAKSFQESKHTLRSAQGLALINHQKISKLVLIHYTRLSFHDVAQVPVLYEISFFDNFEIPPQVKIYRTEKETLRLIDISKMHLKVNESSQVQYSSMEGGALEFSFTLYPLYSQTIYVCLDNHHQPFFACTTAEGLIEPIARLRAYLELLVSPTCPTFLQERIELETEQLLAVLLKSNQQRYLTIKTLGYDPVALNALLYYRMSHFGKKNAFTAFLEQILSGFEQKVISEDESTLLLQQDKTNYSLIKFIDSKKNEKKAIESAFKTVQEHSKNDPKIRFDVEFLSPYMTSPEKLLKEKNPAVHRIYFSMLNQEGQLEFYTFDPSFKEITYQRNFHPVFTKHLELERFQKFNLKRDWDNSPPYAYLLYAQSEKARDQRLVGIALIFAREFSLNCSLADLELNEAFDSLINSMRASLQNCKPEQRPAWNRMNFQVMPVVDASEEEAYGYIAKLVAGSSIEQRLNLEKIVFKFKLKNSKSPVGFDIVFIEASELLGIHYKLKLKKIDEEIRHDFISPASSTELREQQMRSKGGTWAYRIPGILSSAAEKFSKVKQQEPFVELDLDPSSIVIDPKTNTLDYNRGTLIPVMRPLGENQAGVIMGILSNDLGLGFPVKRLIILGDITHLNRGAITAEECARINAAIRLASRERIPIDWFSASYGVEIKSDKGVESLDASSSTTREIILHCHHHGLQINLIIDDTNIGAQSYWDALAGIMHQTTGLLIMTPRGSMALTGPNALACAMHSTAHSLDVPQLAKELFPKGLQSLSGYELVHGPNTDALMHAKDLQEACEFLIRHHFYTYKTFHQALATKRNEGVNKKVAEEVTKEIRKFGQGYKPNRELISEALRDDHSPAALKLWKDAQGIRWQTFRKGDFPQEPSTLVQEMLIGGLPTMVIFTPIGPLTPTDADIISRAISKADERVPVLLIGSLTGFSCDPLSMENRQLLAGASIAKAIVDHEGPILIVNMGNLVGGTFVVFSKQLHPFLNILALEGSRVQVIGGKSAAKVVFHTRILSQAEEDPRVLKMKQALEKISDAQKRAEKETALSALRREIIAELEDKEGKAFDEIHNVQRAKKVGSIDEIITVDNWREMIVHHLHLLTNRYLQSLQDEMGKAA